MMLAVGSAWQPHGPAGQDGPRVTARSQGKGEGPLRPVKEAHEPLDHCHTPATAVQATAWRRRARRRSNAPPHRSPPPSRLAAWLANLPPEGLRALCTWEPCCRFGREPERRQVGIDARGTVAGTAAEGDSPLAGELGLLWWGELPIIKLGCVTHPIAPDFGKLQKQTLECSNR